MFCIDGIEGNVRTAGRAHSRRGAAVLARVERRDSKRKAENEAERRVRAESEAAAAGVIDFLNNFYTLCFFLFLEIKTALPKHPRSSLHASDVMMRGETFVTDASTLKEKKWMEHNICARHAAIARQCSVEA